jgi:hypothetical protein
MQQYYRGQALRMTKFEMCIFYWKNVQAKHYLGDLGVKGMIILIWILKEKCLGS